MIRETVILISGMTCDHCVKNVAAVLQEVPGVDKVEVTLNPGRALVRGSGMEPRKLLTAVEKAGYGATLEATGECCTSKAAKENPGKIAMPTPVKGNEPASRSTAHAQTGGPFSADLLIIGGGSAGFAAAIRGHELGAKVMMVNAGVIGGTCVNVGCVPSKTLIRAAENHYEAKHSRFAGIESSSRVSDFGAIIRQKDALVGSLRRAKYVDVLAAYENIRLVEGRARLVSKDAITVDGRTIRAPRIVVSTGSRPWIPPIRGLSEVEPLTSTTAFELEHLPASVIILGGRYIALECAQMLARLGSKVTILQRSDHILPTEDEDVTTALADYLRQEGITIETSVGIERVTREEGHITVHARVDGEERDFRAERILCATGRRPITAAMGLEEIGIQLFDDGRIEVDDYLKTSIAGVYAAGDVIGEPAFVYTAAYEGRLAAENALDGNKRRRDYAALPWVIFTDPQIAGVGMNEKEASQAGVEIDTATLDLADVPRALAARERRGFIKLVKERDGDRLLGARVLAPEGGEQIMEAAMAIRFGIGVSQIAAMFHPYLTQAEGIKLCAQTFWKDVKTLSCCSG